MKAAPFDYIRPDTLDDACACLASHPDARIIAGGQSLVPMLAMRLARPSLVIDIAHIDGLSAIRDDGDALVIGTMVRQAAALSDPLIATHLPLLAKALTHVGHPPTRSRGTVGGSLVHADPSAEIPLVAVALGACLRMRDSDGDIDFDAADFFIGPMLTLIPPTACLYEIRFPKPNAAYVGTGFHEIATRRSDYALAAAGAHIEADASVIFPSVCQSIYQLIWQLISQRIWQNPNPALQRPSIRLWTLLILSKICMPAPAIDAGLWRSWRAARSMMQ
jgi:CO/xanthine dehydrogenase FAD-binding subunit